MRETTNGPHAVGYARNQAGSDPHPVGWNSPHRGDDPPNLVKVDFLVFSQRVIKNILRCFPWCG